MATSGFTATNFKVTGFAELHKNIETLTQIQRQKAFAPMLQRALEPMQLTAISLAPDDPTTGPPYDLRSSITVSDKQSSRGSRARSLKQYEAMAFMGPTRYGYPEAIMMEFGTIYDVAQPYMRPAWDRDQNKALEIISEHYEEYVFSAARRFLVF